MEIPTQPIEETAKHKLQQLQLTSKHGYPDSATASSVVTQPREQVRAGEEGDIEEEEEEEVVVVVVAVGVGERLGCQFIANTQ